MCPILLARRLRTSQAIRFIVAVSLATVPGAKLFAQNATGISNFGKVNTNYYRGGKLNLNAAMVLKRIGVKTVIDLQEKPDQKEAVWALTSGLKYVNIRLSSKHPATAAETEEFLKLVTDSQNWPVYVHCAGGRHRTGEMTAIYRITHDSWTADQAYDEMKKYEYYSFGGHGSLRDYVYSYYKAWLARANGNGKNRPATILQ